jgi:hypothetical protein
MTKAWSKGAKPENLRTGRNHAFFRPSRLVLRHSCLGLNHSPPPATASPCPRGARTSKYGRTVKAIWCFYRFFGISSLTNWIRLCEMASDPFRCQSINRKALQATQVFLFFHFSYIAGNLPDLESWCGVTGGSFGARVLFGSVCCRSIIPRHCFKEKVKA